MSRVRSRLLDVLPSAGTGEGAPPSTILGDLRVHRFTSRTFRNTRAVRVLLPPGYDDPASAVRRYPVLYLNDGQNLFDRAISFGHVEWQVDETVAQLTSAGEIEPLIVVGIDHALRRRASEYIPYRSMWPPVRIPAGRRYPTFLLNEVVPAIDATYRTAPGPRNRALGGSSLGAAIALYTAIARPGALGALLLESPSLFVAAHRLLVDSRAVPEWPERVYLATGTRESAREEGNAAAVRNVRDLERTLQAAGLGPDRLLTVIDDGAPHSESAWARRLPFALRFLFGKREGSLEGTRERAR